jgi:Skp family chaperone for outer membrane proteins
MGKFYRAIRVAICGLMLLYSFGANAYAAGPCVTEVLLKEMKAYPVAEDKTLELQLQQGVTLEKGCDLGVIPQEALNEEGTALAKDFLSTLPKTLKLEKTLKIQAGNGQKYWIFQGTPFKVMSPKATIPPGTKLIKQEGATPEKYALAEDLTVTISPPKNYQVTLGLGPQTIVERIPDPRISSMGTTLTVKPQRAPIGGCVNLVVKKTGFDFNKALFHVCLRLQGQDKAFIASPDVELKGIKGENAELTACIPKEIDGLGGVHFAQPVDLLVVAQIPEDKLTDKTEARMVEVMTQEFSVSSRPLAVILWILAFVLPWFIAAFIAVYRRGIQANQTRYQAWKAQLNPIWFVSGKYGGASLSLAQILLWTILVFSASFYVWTVSGKLLAITNDVLVLLGIAGGTSVVAKIASSAKEEKGQTLAGETVQEPKWLDLIQTEGRPDLYKFQMALFTLLAVVFVSGKIYGTLEFPELPAGLLTLIGISNGVYLAAKATTKTVFEKLGEKDEELKKAEAELRQAQEELGKRKEEAEKAPEEKKEEANKAKAAADNLVTELQTKVENLNNELKKLKEGSSKPS